MIGHPVRHTAFSIIATMGFVASNLSAASAGRPEGPSLSLSAPTLTLAARCDLQFPIATVHIGAHNHGDAPSSTTNIRVLDTAHELAGSAESLAGPAFCAHENTSTQTLGTTYTRGAWRDHAEQGGLSGFLPTDNVPDGPVVGYFHAKNQSAAGDARYTKIHRYAVAFDMDALRNKRLVSARLNLTIQSSYGAGNNESCATSVASGIEFWWKPDAQSWIEGSFDGSAAPLNTTGPVVTADVTRLVAAIMAGSPNYGFVIRNNDENLGAFTNAQCETVYGNPQLDVVYYDR